jgi:sulfur carrier protein
VTTSHSLVLLVNGKLLETTSTTLAELATELALDGTRYAIEVDGILIPRARHVEYRLNTMQKIEIVHAVGGG